MEHKRWPEMEGWVEAWAVENLGNAISLRLKFLIRAFENVLVSTKGGGNWKC